MLCSINSKIDLLFNQRDKNLILQIKGECITNVHLEQKHSQLMTD